MSSVHSDLGIALIAVNAIAAVLGLTAAAARITRGIGQTAFWRLLRAGQALVLAEGVVGAALLLDGRDLPRLHLIYGLMPIAVAFVAEQLRLASADIVLAQNELEDANAMRALPHGEQLALVASIVRRETTVMATSAVVVTLLCLRAQGWL